MQGFPPELIHTAAELYALHQPPAFFARSHQHSRGCLYETGSYILKILRTDKPSDISTAEKRVRFARYLQSNGLLCQNFIYSKQHKLVELMKFQGEYFLISAWLKIEALPHADLHPNQLTDYYLNWAKLLADTHRLSPHFRGNTPPHWHSEWQACYDSLPDEDVKSPLMTLKKSLDKRDSSAANFGFIHNDAHPKNILENAEGLHLIDFDRSCTHFFVQDIANAIYSEFSRVNFHSAHTATTEEMAEYFLKPFLRAYLQAYPLPAEDLRDLETFLYYRQIIMFGIFYREIEAAAPEYLAIFRENILSRKPFLELDIAALCS